MIKFLIVRHGNSMANKEEIFAGRTNVPLSPVGILQAKFSCEYIYKNYNIDKIYSSELQRAYETVRPLAEKSGLEIERLPDFNEIYGGVWENMKFSEIAEKYPDEYFMWRNDIGNSRCPDGESFLSAADRAYAGLTRLAKENQDGSVIVIGTHAGIIRALQCKIEKIKRDDMKNINWVSNGSVSTVIFTDGVITDFEFGYNKHLGNLITDLPKNI